MVKIIWADLAIEDLQSIHDYIAKDSKTYASKFIELLIERVNQLESFPKSGRIVPEFSIDSIREVIEGNYRIILKTYENHIGINKRFIILPSL